MSELVSDIAAFEPLKSIYVYDLTNPAEEDQFVDKCREFLMAQMTFDALLDKKSIGRELCAHGQEWWQTGEYRFWDWAAGTVTSNSRLRGGIRI